MEPLSSEARQTAPIEHIPCPRCEYDLYRIADFPTTCPECGGTFTHDQLLAPWRLVRRDRACYLVATVGLLGAMLLAGVTGERGGFCILLGIMPLGGLCLGYAEPRKAWRWPTKMLATLMITGAAIEISSGDVGAGPPLALVVPTVLVIPLVLSFILANVGSTLCRTERMKLDEALAREISEASSNAGRSDSHPAE